MTRGVSAWPLVVAAAALATGCAHVVGPIPVSDCDWVRAGGRRWCVADLGGARTCPRELPSAAVLPSRTICVADADAEIGWGFSPALCDAVEGGCGLHAKRARPRRELLRDLVAQPGLSIADRGPWRLDVCRTDRADVRLSLEPHEGEDAHLRRHHTWSQFVERGGADRLASLPGVVLGPQYYASGYASLELQPGTYSPDEHARAVASILRQLAEPDLCVHSTWPASVVPL